MKQKRRIEEVKLKPLEVKPKKGMENKVLVKKFIKKCKKEGVLLPLFEKRYHKTKGQKRREKHKKEVYKQKKKKNSTED